MPKATWNANHHVVPSKGNDRAPRAQRAYFDYLPVMPWRTEDKVSLMELSSIHKLLLLETHDKSARQLRGISPRSRGVSHGGSLSARSRLTSCPSTEMLEAAVVTSPNPGSPVSSSPFGRNTPQRGTLGRNAALVLKLGALEHADDRPQSSTSISGPSKQPSAENALKASHRSWPMRQQSSASQPGNARTTSRQGSNTASGHGSKIAPFVTETKGQSGREQMPVFLRLAGWAEAKHRSIVALWRKLDTNQSGFLHKLELTKGLKLLQYPDTTDLEDLWNILDSDKRGTISFFEFAPASSRLLAGFRRWAESKFGLQSRRTSRSAATLFRTLDANSNRTLSLSEFKLGCQRNDLPEELSGSLEEIFWLLDCDGRNTISESELEFLDTWKCPPFLWGNPDTSSRRAFKQALMNRHRCNPILAWRALDRGARMRVSWDEFQIVCRDLAQSGLEEAAPAVGVADLFVSFDLERDGSFGVFDFDRSAYRILASFTAFVREKGGRISRFVKSPSANFEQANSVGGMTYAEFTAAIENLRLKKSERMMLFEGFARGSDKVLPSDVAFLDSWDLDSMDGVAKDSASLLREYRQTTSSLSSASSV